MTGTCALGAPYSCQYSLAGLCEILSAIVSKEYKMYQLCLDKIYLQSEYWIWWGYLRCTIGRGVAGIAHFICDRR